MKMRLKAAEMKPYGQIELEAREFTWASVKGRTGVRALSVLAGIIWLIGPQAAAAKEAASGPPPEKAAAATPTPGPEALGVSFVEGSTSTVIVERAGKKYLVDLTSHQIKEMEEAAAPAATPKPQALAQSKEQEKAPKLNAPSPSNGVYEAGDDFIFSLPTGRRLERHGFYVNFNHRFAFNTAFTGPARGHLLLGLDDFSLSSFGFRYGLTRNAFVEIYRSPSVIGRPIQFSGGYNLLDEHDGKPFNASVRVSIEGQNDFQRNYTTDFEGIFSRSLMGRAQIYFVPTLSLHDRPLAVPQRNIADPFPYQPCSSLVAADVAGRTDIRPCANTFSLGVGGALDIRPSVALVGEIIPTLTNGQSLGIHRPAYSFGIQKKIWRHAFTFGFSNSPGTTVSQRAGTRATMLGDPSADTPSGLFIGFDLTRQMF